MEVKTDRCAYVDANNKERCEKNCVPNSSYCAQHDPGGVKAGGGGGGSFRKNVCYAPPK
jgi:hypothetical protein